MSFRRRFRDLRDFISFSVISLQAFGIDAELAVAQLVISIEHHASVGPAAAAQDAPNPTIEV